MSEATEWDFGPVEHSGQRWGYQTTPRGGSWINTDTNIVAPLCVTQALNSAYRGKLPVYRMETVAAKQVVNV